MLSASKFDEEKMISGSFGIHSLCLRHRCILLNLRALKAASCHTSSSRDSISNKKEILMAEEAAKRAEAYRQLENLDFKSAAKILFTTPPKRKKFGLDFHLVQLFFACLPSLAVYLVAQYARSEIRRMEAEVEQKKKQAELEDKAKLAELPPSEDLSNNELEEVKIRLGALEETVKEIVVEKRKGIHGELNNNQRERNETIEPAVGKSNKDENQNQAKDLDTSSMSITHNNSIQHKDATDIAATSSREEKK